MANTPISLNRRFKPGTAQGSAIGRDIVAKWLYKEETGWEKIAR